MVMKNQIIQQPLKNAVFMYRYLVMFCLFFIAILCGCKETDTAPLDKGDQAPQPVSNVTIEPTAGGAKIAYNRPENMLYVKATYFIRDGVEREVKASYYNSMLEIEGFSEVREYEVRLYAVSRGENSSAPVVLKVVPLPPPIVSVFKTLQMQSIFGGVRILFENASEADLSINLLTQDSFGEFVPAETFYTKRKAGSVNARGYAPVEKKFGVYLRDRWNNHSDTLYASVTPLFEVELAKNKFKGVNLPTDTYEQHCCGNGLGSLWDGKWNVSGNDFHSKPGTGLPQWFTIDLGVTVSLSRFKFYHRKSDGIGAASGAYNGADPKLFELWGSNNPNADGSWGNWELISEFQSVKPSGLPVGSVSSEDFQFAVIDGEDFDIPPGTPKYRYLRWKTKKVWGSLDHVYMEELTFWGGEQ